MLTFKEYISEQKTKGTYAATRPVDIDSKILNRFKTKHDLVNDEPLHCTLLYSKKYLPNYKPDPGLMHNAKVVGLKVWPSHNADDDDSSKNYLVLILSCNSLQQRYKSLTDEHGATSDYDKYTPHITLGCGKKEFNLSDYDISELPKAITLSNEYSEDLDLS